MVRNIVAFLVISWGGFAHGAGSCDVAAMTEKARQECAGGNSGSCFIFTTLIDNKESWKAIEQTCLQECKGNPANCGKYQQLGKQLMDARCAVDPDACELKKQINGQPRS